MRRISKLIVLPLICVTLSSCELLKILNDLLYANVEEFYKKEGYAETASEDEFNTFLQEKMYVWRQDVRTYTNTQDQDDLYYSPHSDTILDYVRNNQITYYTNKGEKVVILNGENPSVSYRFEEQDEISFKNKELHYIDANRFINDMDAEHENLLRVQPDNNGYLFLTGQNSLFYLTKDYKRVYPYVRNTQKFEFNGEEITVPESELLTRGLATQQDKPKLAIPIPSGTSVHHKDYYNIHDRWYAYDVLIPNIKATEYVPLLERNGFEVYRGENHGLLEITADNGGEWIAYDPNLEFSIHIQYKSAFCAARDSHDNSGVQLHIMPMKEELGQYGVSPNVQTDWKEDEKATMTEKFGFVLPFVNMGRKYNIPTTKRKNGESPLESPFDMDAECYFIFDNFYKDVITENYGNILEQAGFTPYVAPVKDRSDNEAFKAWYYSNDVVFYQCYLNDNLRVAIKFGFDDIYGNCIRVFNYDDMIPWHAHLDD